VELYTFLSQRLWKIKGITRVEASHVIHMVRYAYDWGRDIDGRTPGAGRQERVAVSPKQRSPVPETGLSFDG